MIFISLLFVALATQGFCAPAEHKISKRLIFGPAPLDFARPPTGVYAGGIGGMFGSPVFGPPLVGPFNNPILREERIMELFDHNRIRNNRPKFEERFSLGDIDMGFDMSEPLPGIRRDRHERPDRNGRRRSRGQY